MKEFETMKQLVEVAVNVNQVALMYAWTFKEGKPKDMTYREAADKIMEQHNHDMIDIMIRESQRLCANFDLYKAEIKKFQAN